MKKIKIFFILPFILIALLLTSCTKKIKVYKVGILCGLSLFKQAIDTFTEKMTDLGYIEGENIIYDRQMLQTEDDKKMQEILEEFVQNEVDLILAVPTEAALKAKHITEGTDIPVVFASAYTNDNNLIKSIKEPGNNITGVRWPSSAEIGVKRVEIFHEIVPEAKKVWLAYDKNYPSVLARIKALRQVIGSLGMSMVEVPVLSITDIETDLKTRDKLNDIDIDVIMLTGLRFGSFDDLGMLKEFANKHKVPMIVGDIEFSLFGLRPSMTNSGEHSAYLVDKILKGNVSAGKIPVITAENYLQINYKKAQELGIVIPEVVLARANEIIK